MNRRDLRVAFIGNVDSGKSSLIGTLSAGELDDGRGSSRRVIFRHKHEQDTGRTSSIATSYIGFESSGAQIYGRRHGHRQMLSVKELAQKASSCIQLIDLAGHEKYLKTTVYGLTGMQPNFAVVVVGANMGVKRMTKEHISIAMALDIPVIIVLTKIDIAPKNIAKETLVDIRQYLRKNGKMPMLVKTSDQAEAAVESIPSNRITPIFPLSNVTGEGLDNLRHLLSRVHSKLFTRSTEIDQPLVDEAIVDEDQLASSIPSLATISETKPILELKDAVLPIDETYQVPGVGFVVAGTISRGRIQINDVLHLGPDHNGNFAPVIVRSIEAMYVPIREMHAGQHASLNIRLVNRKLVLNRTTYRKGMVLLGSTTLIPRCVSRVFEARVLILHHQTTIAKGYEPLINCQTIRQSAKILSIDRNRMMRPENPLDEAHDSLPLQSQRHLRTGDRALVRFQFSKYAEYIPVKSRFVFRDGQTKGIGKIIRVITSEAGKNEACFSNELSQLALVDEISNVEEH